MFIMGEEWCTARHFPSSAISKVSLSGKAGVINLRTLPRSKTLRNGTGFRSPIKGDVLAWKLDWEQKDYGIHCDWLNWYKRILAIRRDRVMPLLPKIGGNTASYETRGESAVYVRWNFDQYELALAANLSSHYVENFPDPRGKTLGQEGPDDLGITNRPWSVRWYLKTLK